MRRCSQYLHSKTNVTQPNKEISLSLAHEASKGNNTWARFYVLLCPVQSTQYAEEFWGVMGDGISSRHADFVLERLPFMQSISSDSSLGSQVTSDGAETVPPEPWKFSDVATKLNIKRMIAGCVTSQEPRQEVVVAQDVFLYPKGMCAIGTLARILALTSTHSSEAIIFG